jgi:hypothetical protein
VSIFNRTKQYLRWLGTENSPNNTQNIRQFIQLFYGLPADSSDKGVFFDQINGFEVLANRTNSPFSYFDEIKKNFLNFIRDPIQSVNINGDLDSLKQYFLENKTGMGTLALFVPNFITNYGDFFFLNQGVARRTAETKERETEETGVKAKAEREKAVKAKVEREREKAEREKAKAETAEKLAKQAESIQALGVKSDGSGRHRAPKNKKVIFQTGAKTKYQRY